MAEVRRLEDVRYQQMVDLVLHKGAELQGLCAASHVAQPAGLEQALAEMRATTTTCTDEEGVGGMVLERNPGAAAELLAKLLHMLAEVQVCTDWILGVGVLWVGGYAEREEGREGWLTCGAIEIALGKALLKHKLWRCGHTLVMCCDVLEESTCRSFCLAPTHTRTRFSTPPTTQPHTFTHTSTYTQVLTAKRGSIIAAINEVEGARQEDVWLAAYEADDQRYKVGGGGAVC